MTGLEQQVIGPAGHESQGLHAVVLDELLESHAARHRDGFGGRPHGAADEAWPGRHRERPGGFPSQLGRRSVEIEGLAAEVVLCQHQWSAAKTVGLHDVGPGFEISAVEPQHDIRPRDAEVLVTAFEIWAAEIFGRQVLALESGTCGTIHD